MFTGIIEGIGTVQGIRAAGESARLIIDLGRLAEGVQLGESIAVDGACLTAAQIRQAVVEFDVSRETLARSTLGGLTQGDKVHLERALRLGDRLGGHLVLGHVDGVGTISGIEKSSGQMTLTVIAPTEIISRLVHKGSVAISGISLTVASLAEKSFSIAVIPHTLENTTLLSASVGNKVNLELDILGKYVERLLGARAQTEAPGSANITREFLQQHGFE